jgi:hypothetical protein
MFESGKINFEEGIIILELLDEKYPKFKGKGGELLFLRKQGISSCCLVSSVCDIYFEGSMKIIERLSFSDLIEELKLIIA